MKILLCVDGSEYTRHMLDFVAAHRDWLGTGHQLTALFAVPVLPARAAMFWDREDLLGDQRTEAERVLAPVRAFFEAQSIVCEIVSEAGDAPDIIAAHATEGHFDLLIIGSRGHGKLSGLVLGSVASGVLAKCKVPALVIR